jgi:hypothetical protein
MVGNPLPTSFAAGADLKVVQDQLGHSTVALTADTYTSVLPETARAAAERTAVLLVPASPRPAKRGRSAARAGTQAAAPGMGTTTPPKAAPHSLNTACNQRGPGTHAISACLPRD